VLENIKYYVFHLFQASGGEKNIERKEFHTFGKWQDRSEI
jgi:hypothetical protein